MICSPTHTRALNSIGHTKYRMADSATITKDVTMGTQRFPEKKASAVGSCALLNLL